MELRTDLIPLVLLMGGLTYLLLHELSLLRSSWRDRFVPWALAWTATALIFTAARIVHRGATTPELAVMMMRAEYVSGLVVGWISPATLRVFTDRKVLGTDAFVLLASAVVLSVLVIATPWLIEPQHLYVRADALGASYYSSEPGPLIFLVGIYGIASVSMNLDSLRLLPTAGPVTRRIVAVVVLGFIVLGINDLLLATELVPTVHLFEYGFAGVAALCGLFLQRRTDLLHRDLEVAVENRTEALWQSESRFRQLSDSTFEGVAVHRVGVVFDCNEALARIFRRPSERFLDQQIRDLFHEDSRALLDRLLSGAETGPVQAIAQRGDGEDFPVELASHVPERISADKARVLVIRDLSERLEMQQHLIRTDRLASMGTLAAGTAHEINNPLAYVIANAQLLDEELRRLAPMVPTGELDDAQQLLLEVEEGAGRVRRIVKDLMAMAREPDAETGSVDIAHVIESSAQLARNELRHRAKVVLDFEPVPEVRGSEHRLVQVFLNLLVNAAHAIPEGRADEHQIRVRVRRDEGDQVLVEVADDGEGMSPEVSEHIFDPFFTTKPVGRGTGLGLAIGHGIVSSLGGEMTVESEEGAGSTFSVRLPLSGQGGPTSKAKPVSSIRPAMESPKRVLIVDDEPGVARALRRALRDHQVEVAGSGRDALERCETQRFDLVICDLMMPELTGMDVHRALTERDPDLARRMVFVTGGVFTDSARSFLDEIENPVFDKPVDVRKLRKLVATYPG